ADLRLEEIVRMETRRIGGDGVDASALLERLDQRVLHQDREVIGPFRIGVVVDRAVGLDQRDARAVEVLGIRRRADREPEIDLGPCRSRAARGLQRIELLGYLGGTDQVAARREHERRASQKDGAAAGGKELFGHLGVYPLWRSPKISLVGWRSSSLESRVRLATSPRDSRNRSEICARPSPLTNASASSESFPSFFTLVSASTSVGPILFDASARLRDAAEKLARVASMSPERLASAVVVVSRLPRIS